MIEVKATLIRGSVYLAGETIECLVTFRNPLPHPHAQSQSNNDIEEILAWASAQIHCQCSVVDSLVKFPSSVSQEELATASQDTSFIPCRGERGHVVASTKPKILFCDLRLLPGESKTFVYRETIPSEAPPSYRGKAVKYVYKITIGTQRVNAVIKLLKLPIRVLILCGLTETLLHSESEDLQVAPTNPFLQSQHKQSALDIALQLLETVTARRSPSYYNITNQHGKVVRFCLLKAAYRLGEDIVGVFDFSQATVQCVQFLVSLVSEELLKDHCKMQSKQGVATVVYNKYYEFCLHMKHTQMIIPIPLTVTPAFSTDIVSLRWKLHFEFVTCPQIIKSSEETFWQGPLSVDVQTMVWDLPITIYPTHPLQVAHGLPSKQDYSLTI